jgi:hypothetical protein
LKKEVLKGDGGKEVHLSSFTVDQVFILDTDNVRISSQQYYS